MQGREEVVVVAAAASTARRKAAFGESFFKVSERIVRHCDHSFTPPLAVRYAIYTLDAPYICEGASRYIIRTRCEILGVHMVSQCARRTDAPVQDSQRLV